MHHLRGVNPTAEDVEELNVSIDETAVRTVSKSKFKKGDSSEPFTEPVSSMSCTMQAVITSNQKDQVPSFVRLKASPYPDLRDARRWFHFHESYVTDTIGPRGDPALSTWIYCSDEAVMARAALFRLTLDCFSDMSVIQIPGSAHPEALRWSFPNVQSKGAYAATFVDRVERERLPAALLKGYGLDNITNVIVGLTASLLKQANYDSPSSEVGCSVSNISRMLADLEVAVDVKCATLTRPFASPLKGGNEEDDDNTYIEYVSHIVDQGHNILSRSDFKANDVGLFISTLLSQEVANRKVPQVSSPIPRPTKSCRPDFLEAMKGAPTLVGEGKTLSQRKASGETVQIDTTEGLYYSTIQAVNLFNWLPRTCPAIVLHITDTRFRVQAVHLDCKHDIIRVYQRSCSAYNLEAVPSGLDIDDDVLKRFPSFSFYDRVSRDEINEHRGYLDKVGAGTKTSHAEAFKARQFAEAVARSLQMGKSAHEVHKKRQAEKSKRDQRRQELPGATESRGKPPKTPPTPSPTESHAEDECIPFMGDSYMLGREYDESETYRQKWKNLSSTLRTYIMSAWEAIDILVQLKLQQNEEEAARNYEASLQSGLFCPPQKFRLQNLIQPRGRNNEINAGDFMYDNCANWQTVDVSEVSPEFTHAVEATRADLAVRYLPPPPEQGIYQPPGAMWAQGAAAHEFVPTPQFKAQIHREVDAALQKEQDRA